MTNALRSLAMLLLLTPAAGATDDDAVESVGRQLKPAAPGMPSRFPWYDAASDGIRPLIPPKPPSEHRLFDGLFNFLGRIVESAFTAFMWLAGACIVGVLAYLLIQRFLSLRKESTVVAAIEAPIQIDRIEQLPVRVKGIDDFLAAAEGAAAQGDLAQAAVYYFSHQLLMLDKAGVIRLTKGKTNRRYLREIADNHPELSPAMRLSVSLFEDVFFGRLPIDRQRFDRLWSERRQFRAELEAKA